MILSVIELDLAAAEAYRLSAGACTSCDLKNQLLAFGVGHERHAAELSDWARSQGGEPVTELGEVGKVLKAA